LSTFIIALREGLEACLIVGILVAYIVKTNRQGYLKPLWTGVVAAVVLSIALGAFLTLTSVSLSERGQEFFAGITSFIAVALVTWMVFWMKRTARTLRSELQGKLDNAVATGPLALAGVAFVAVIREGLETSLFVYTNFQTVADVTSSTIGLLLGFAVAITLGYLIYKSAIKLNLAKFFTYSGVALIIVAAGVLSYGIHELQELGYLPGPDAFAWDVTSFIAKDSILGASLSGTIGFDATTSWPCSAPGAAGTNSPRISRAASPPTRRCRRRCGSRRPSGSPASRCSR
jgi:high-affinity iron transporter